VGPRTGSSQLTFSVLLALNMECGKYLWTNIKMFDRQDIP